MAGEWLWLRRNSRARWRSMLAVATLERFDRVSLDALFADASSTDCAALRGLGNPKIPMAAFLAAAHVELPPGTGAGLEVALVSGIRHVLAGAVGAIGPRCTEGLAGRAE